MKRKRAVLRGGNEPVAGVERRDRNDLDLSSRSAGSQVLHRQHEASPRNDAPARASFDLLAAVQVTIVDEVLGDLGEIGTPESGDRRQLLLPGGDN
jgi:hypothetical protein